MSQLDRVCSAHIATQFSCKFCANLCTHEISTEPTLFTRGQTECQGWGKLKAALYAIRTEIAYAGQYIHVPSTVERSSYKIDYKFEPKK